MLNKEQIINKIENPVCGESLQAGIRLQDGHKIHVTGDGYARVLSQLVGFESKADYDIRVQLTGPATIQLCAIIIDNLNRWATNQGTVKSIQFKQEGQADEFGKVMGQIWKGKSLEEFVSTFYKEAIYQEMEGFLLITKPQLTNEGTQVRDGIEMAYDGESLNPYMIFIQAEDVKDYNGVGDTLEYIIFDVGEGEDGQKIYRVIDSQQDTIFKYDGHESDKSQVLSTIVNEVGYVPAIQVSNIAKDLKNDKIKTSPIDHVIPALNRYMQKDSDLIIQMVRHMYPKLASVTTACKMCDGQGYDYSMVDSVETKIKCNDCNGTGKVIPISRDGVLGLPQFIDEGKTPYPGSPASYIVPDNASLQIGIDDLKDLAKDILYSATGDKNLIVEGLETATENLINFKGLEDRIAEIIDMVESREEFIIKTVAKMHKDFNGGFEGVSVRYGRRMVIRGESEIMTEIDNAKEAGMPISHIETLQRELIYTRYKNNRVELERQQLLADVEPLNGYTVAEVLDMVNYVSKEDLKIKFNFNRLLDLFEDKFGSVVLYKVDAEWKARVIAIYNEFKLLSDEILPVEQGSGQD